MVLITGDELGYFGMDFYNQIESTETQPIITSYCSNFQFAHMDRIDC